MTNPFVPVKPEAPQPVVDVGDEFFDGEVVASGPATPEVAPPAHPTGPRWGETEVEVTDALCVMALHGGAGASTVAELLGVDNAIATGHGWPVAAGWARPRPVLDVLAVCRNHRKGIEAGTEFARQWAAGQLESSNLIGIVIVDDGPTLLKAQVTATKAIARMTPRGWHLPWHEPWRVESVDPETLPRKIATVKRSILKTHKKIMSTRSKQ